jgi:aspartate kinase
MEATQVRVHKYGGSSVADVDKIKQVAVRVAAQRKLGVQMVVVVSAMGDTTDDLLKLAKQVSPNPSRRELDMLLTAGERISMALLSMALNDAGTPAISFTGSQSGILTTDDHAQARITEVRPTRVKEALAEGKVVIVAGYQGVSPQREVTTLGRGGSDTTAVAMASALGAACEIYSDVDGVFTADPRVVHTARKIEALSYEEMQELARCGAKVLNAQAVEFARQSGVVIRALSTFVAGTGTRIEAASGPEVVRAIATDTEVALLTAAPSQAEAVAAFLAARRVHARALEPTAHHAWAVPLADMHDDAFGPALAALGGTLHRELGLLSAVGRAALAAEPTLARAIADASVEVVAWCRQPLSLGAFVPRAVLARLAQASHAALIER